MGNHETYMDPEDDNQQNTVFSDHFYLPNESKLGSKEEKAEDGSRIYHSGDYYYTYGDTLFLMINSNEGDASVHEAFIKEAIAKATKEHGKNFSWKVASFHHAPYSTATHTSDDDIIKRRQQLVSIFNENAIDIVLNGHDHIYSRSKHMLSGEQVLTFMDAYGTDPKDENAGIEDGFTKTYNNKVYNDGKVIVDGIGIDYEGNSVTNPRGTLFLTMSASAGAKFYNPIGEDQWFVNRSLDDRSQLFSNLSFSKNEFKIVTMDPYGNVVDTYTINKTDDFIANPLMNQKEVSKAKLAEFIAEVEKLEVVSTKENINTYNEAIAKAKNVLRYEMSNQEEVDAAIEVLKTRLTAVEFKDAKIISEKPDNENKDDKAEKVEVKEVKKEVASIKAPAKAVEAKKTTASTDNPKTGVASLSAVASGLTVAISGLFATKKRK